jgi:hypothetical protein
MITKYKSNQQDWLSYWENYDATTSIDTDKLKKHWFNLQLVPSGNFDFWHVVDSFTGEVLLPKVIVNENWQDACQGLIVLRDFINK